MFDQYKMRNVMFPRIWKEIYESEYETVSF